MTDLLIFAGLIFGGLMAGVFIGYTLANRQHDNAWKRFMK